MIRRASLAGGHSTHDFYVVSMVEGKDKYHHPLSAHIDKDIRQVVIDYPPLSFTWIKGQGKIIRDSQRLSHHEIFYKIFYPFMIKYKSSSSKERITFLLLSLIFTYLGLLTWASDGLSRKTSPDLGLRAGGISRAWCFHLKSTPTTLCTRVRTTSGWLGTSTTSSYNY